MIYANVLEKRQAQALEIANLVDAFVAKGGTVKLAKPGRKAGNTFFSKGAVAYKGAKATNLKNIGLYVR